jgi:hypothetical protein
MESLLSGGKYGTSFGTLTQTFSLVQLLVGYLVICMRLATMELDGAMGY